MCMIFAIYTHLDNVNNDDTFVNMKITWSVFGTVAHSQGEIRKNL